MTTGQALVWYEGSGTAASDRRYLSADERGSIISVSDSTGASLGVNSYDEFGMPGATNLGRYGYTGQAWIGELGLYYYKARFYSPALGRFMQTDPVGYDDQVNLYAYVDNDPINRVDPTGEQDTSVERAIDRDIRDLQEDRIDEEEYIQRQQWRGAGAAIGTAILLTGGRAIPWLGRTLGLGQVARTISISSSQLGAKFGQHYREWGLPASKAGAEKFRSITERIAANPDRVVSGYFSGGEKSGRLAADFYIKGKDVVVTTRKGEYVTTLKGGIDNPNVQKALKVVCVVSRIPQASCD